VTRQDKTIDPRIITYIIHLLTISVAVPIDEDNTYNNNMHDKAEKLEKKTRAYAGGVYLEINLTSTSTHHTIHTYNEGDQRTRTMQMQNAKHHTIRRYNEGDQRTRTM
jgi:hypothetical protein